MDLRKIGVWTCLDALTSQAAAAFALRVEELGYSTLWMPETFGRNPLVFSSWLLANTSKLQIATGIASIYARDAVAMKAGQMSLAEQSDGRFLLGLGVSHAPMVERLRGHDYGRPVKTMRDYLNAMARAPYTAVRPARTPETVLAALGPKMLHLSAEAADGAHSYNVTPQHTAEARAIIGPDKLLCVEQKVMLETDADVARAGARKMIRIYLGLRNYQESWRREGFDEADWSGEGSDRLIDALFAWGDAKAIRARIQAHLDAGATQVCIQPIASDGKNPADTKLLEALAP